MNEWDIYKEQFQISSLEDIYTNHVIFSGAVGIDKMSHNVFTKSMDKQLDVISKKSLAGEYKYTKYRLRLVSKGRGKVPREISIPTIRDRIALKALCNFLNSIFSVDVTFDLPQNVIRDVKKSLDSGKYNAFIKLDVKQFYPSINHNILAERLNSQITRNEIINQLKYSYTTATVEKPSDLENNVRGIPQGLAVSNMLAAIYLAEIDNMYGSKDFAYFRYVDDILIFCKRTEAGNIAEEIVKKFSDIQLEVHKPDGSSEKSKIGNLRSDTFTYLGYRFDSGRATVRKESIDRLRDSLTAIFTAYRYSKKKDQKFLQWRLDLRIGGCVFENKRRGWLFFFSEIDDLELLHQLDYFVFRLCKRFGVSIKPKSFVRAYYQIKHNIYETKYIPNFDKYSVVDMKDILEKVFDYKDLDKETDRKIEYLFKKKVTKQVRDLEEDLQDFGY